MDAWDNEQLSDTVPGIDRVGAPSNVHQLRLYGTPIARIDNSKRVRKHQTVLAGKARADRRRTDPLTALAAVGLLLILEHRYHFPLLYVGLFDVVGLYHNTILFVLKKALRRHRDVDNQNESLVCLCARKSEVQALNGGLAYELKEPIGPHFRYFIACFAHLRIRKNRHHRLPSIVPMNHRQLSQRRR